LYSITRQTLLRCKGVEFEAWRPKQPLGRYRRPARALFARAAATGRRAWPLGGVGKTRLGIEYAFAHEAEYSAQIVVSADSPPALRQNVAALCAVAVLDLPERTATDEEIQVGAALRWFEEHSGWLLILDNVDKRETADAVEAPRASQSQPMVAASEGAA